MKGEVVERKKRKKEHKEKEEELREKRRRRRKIGRESVRKIRLCTKENVREMEQNKE